MKFKFSLLPTLVILLALALTSCGSSNNSSIIATSVALTVQAQNTQPSLATDTDTPEPLPTETPTAGTPAVTTPTIAAATFTPTRSGSTLNCSIVANFVSENIPDGTIESPGAVFIKTWNIQNNGTCIWDTSWRIAYDSGDLLGAGYVYNFPQTVAPGQTVPISLQLTAPLVLGIYTGYWYLEPPPGSGSPFGVDQYNTPLSVKINVNSGTPGKGTPTVYGITSVTYNVTYTGTCNSANLFFTIAATVSASGPLNITYYWHHSDGYNSSKKTLTFSDAGSQVVVDTWSQKVGSSATSFWDQLIEMVPVKQAFGKAPFQMPCY